MTRHRQLTISLRGLAVATLTTTGYLLAAPTASTVAQTAAPSGLRVTYE